jgi:hypothetical protein
MAGKQTGITGLADVSAGQRDHVLPGARCARPGPIGLLDEDTDDALQGKPPIPVSSSQIRVKVTSDGTTPIPDLRCTVIVGSSAPTTITTDKQGILVSSDKSPGSVTIAVPDKLIKISSDVTPTASLTISPQASVRGATATISITPPNGAFGFKVAEWKYDISHTNPGDPAAATGSVTRPTNEGASTFDKEWSGILVGSGKASARFIVGVTVREAGNAAVNATVTAMDPVSISLNVSVTNRSNFKSLLKENPEGTLNVTIGAKFENLGGHGWEFTSPPNDTLQVAAEIASGPNKGCKFLSAFKGTFVSKPQLNAELKNAASVFARAQDKAYLTEINAVSLKPAKEIPRNLYDILPNSGGTIKIKDEPAFRTALGLKATDSFANTGHCITQGGLLSGTRLHESGHKENCLKALRALDPGAVAEALIQLPGKILNFAKLVTDRITVVANANSQPNDGHNVVDEVGSRSSQSLAFISGKELPGCNTDQAGNSIGPAWDPTQNAKLK